MSEQPVRVEATGETVGEARWAALHDLERQFPDLDRDAVQFVVVSEGQRGLLGVGYEPARVIATLTEVPEVGAAGAGAAAAAHRASEPAEGESEQATAVRRLMDEVVAALGIDGDVQVSQERDTISATVRGEDLGILIGKHGQTIDAVQYLANSMLHRHGRGVEAVIDAEGYRARRERTLGEVAARAVDEVRRTGQPVALEPMSSAERKIVHNKVQDIPGMATSSEGAEPNRYVVVAPSEE
jgi:spoIIIJ-associated protein